VSSTGTTSVAFSSPTLLPELPRGRSDLGLGNLCGKYPAFPLRLDAKDIVSTSEYKLGFSQAVSE